MTRIVGKWKYFMFLGLGYGFFAGIIVGLTVGKVISVITCITGLILPICFLITEYQEGKDDEDISEAEKELK